MRCGAGGHASRRSSLWPDRLYIHKSNKDAFFVKTSKGFKSESQYQIPFLTTPSPSNSIVLILVSLTMEYNQDLPKVAKRRPVYCWGHAFLPKQVGVVTYQMSPNRINPLAHIFHSAIFNTFRRCRNQFLYVVPPFAAAYLIMSWAEERNKFLNSKAGRVENDPGT